MTDIEEAKDAVVEFLQKAVGTENVKVIGAKKTDNQWRIEAEVYEESSFMKSLGLPTRVQDRNIYNVTLNDDLQVESYERQDHPLTTN
jgi:alcohol dehydrogenase YqhD (iron-dependent ADH family)